MADVLIRGIEMPCDVEGCEVIIRIQPNGEVLDAHKIHIGATAIPLPEGHGRLIDADALAAQFKKQIVNEDDLMELCKRAGLMSNYFNESKVQIGMVTFMRMLNDAKTIVPTEEGNIDDSKL